MCVCVGERGEGDESVGKGEVYVEGMAAYRCAGGGRKGRGRKERREERERGRGEEVECEDGKEVDTM